MASVYGRQFSGAPQRGLGATLATHELRVGNDAWSATADRRKIGDKVVMGVVLCVRRNKHAGAMGGERREEWFIPFDELAVVGFEFVAHVDTQDLQTTYPERFQHLGTEAADGGINSFDDLPEEVSFNPEMED